MKFLPLSLGLLMAPLAYAATTCGNEKVDHDPINMTKRDHRESMKRLKSREVATIDTYIHILVSKMPEENLAPKIQGQMDFLNKAYAKWGYQFKTKYMILYENAEWAKDIDVDKENKMRSIHRGDYQTLNVYLVEGAGGGVCSFPSGDGKPVNQDTLDFDGCFIPMDVGLSPTSGTLAHEVGHWFGLLHTFQGGCEGDGDYCDDTNPQSEPSLGKLAKEGDLNSCPAKDMCGKGPSNVKNFMDYSDCCHEFTPCQGRRMEHTWTKLRKGRKLADGVKPKW